MSFDVDLTVDRADRKIAARFHAGDGVTALFGPSGAGKTTVLDAIAGILRPRSGRIEVGGTCLFDTERAIDIAPEQRRCGYVFQDLRLFPHRTVRDNLLFGWRLAAPPHRWMSLDEAAAFLGIGHLLSRRPGTLSGGEAQRVAIGRALLSAPRFLLMDEPLSSLDMPRRAEIISVIERIRDELRLPILYVTHDPTEATRLSARIVTLADVGTEAD